ncbi:Cof-type HAD-IIB family hydrolase [Ruminococcus sp. HUN007]|uniref:Cof-type HAD-IIB family hydrolase n=1 Tax=Ruminococcus sp. HUN007 TaxID=1514668 RepID=UPI0006797F91|nr:Cof-type HAD-IIB family hydrolase [Ruminococcus sp. HUN007]
MKKIMFFDIDGTLIPEVHGAAVPESTLKALELARKAGNLLYINTGRPYVNVDDDVRSLGFDGYVYGCGTMVECEGEEIWYNRLEKDLCMKTAELIRSCNAVPMYERKDCVLFDFTVRKSPVIDKIRENFALEGKNVDHCTEDEDFSFDKFIVAFDEHTDLKRLMKELEKDYFWIDRGPVFAEIVPKPCSKATGIEMVLKHYGMDKSQAYAIGDSLNDLPMFSAAGTSISMGNGEKLKQYADYVTDDIMENGIYNAMEKYGFF